MYDVIGDIHGQAGKLEALLRHLGYVPQGRSCRAPVGRQAVFLGDFGKRWRLNRPRRGRDTVCRSGPDRRRSRHPRHPQSSIAG